jgi:hypothetical protein
MSARTYELAFPERLPNGAWRVLAVINSECRSRAEALLFLSDRVANCQAFPGEFVRAAKAVQS